MKILKTVNSVNPVETQEDEKGIMIVDDSKFSRNILKDILQNEGFNVIAEAKNGLEAVEMTKQKKPQYIFMDVEMPVLDGLGAIPKILEVDPKVHIIMCTAMGQKNIIVEAARAGAKDYVLKPYKKENIIRVLSMIIEPKQKDGQVIPFKNGKKNKDDTQNQSATSVEEKLQEELANKVRQVITEEAFLKSIQSEEPKQPNKRPEESVIGDRQATDLGKEVKKDHPGESIVEAEIMNEAEVNIEQSSNLNNFDKSDVDLVIDIKPEEAQEITRTGAAEEILEEAIVEASENTSKETLKEILEETGVFLELEEATETLEVAMDILKEMSEFTFDQAPEDNLLRRDAETLEPLQPLQLQENNLTGKEEALPPLDLSADSNSAKESTVELELALEGTDNLHEEKARAEIMADGTEKDEIEEEKLLDNMETMEESNEEDNVVIIGDLMEEDQVNKEEDQVNKEEDQISGEENQVNSEEDQISGEENQVNSEVDQIIREECQENRENQINKEEAELELQGGISHAELQEKAGIISVRALEDIAIIEDELLEPILEKEEYLESLSYAPADRIDYTFLWTDRFQLWQQGLFQPGTIRLSLYNAAHLASDGFGLVDWKPSSKKIMSGMINAYLNLDNRLRDDEELLISKAGNGQEGTRVLSEMILVEERMERADLTMADFLNQSDTEPHAKAIIKNSNLSNMMQQLIHSKAERVLVNEASKF